MTESVKRAFAARSKQHAKDQIAQLVKECRAGENDREADAIELAALWGLDGEQIHDHCSWARGHSQGYREGKRPRRSHKFCTCRRSLWFIAAGS